jgi:hypothetical protein
LDSTTGDKKIRIYHNSGTYLEMQNNGSVNINTTSNHVENITGTCNINVTGNCSVTAPKVTITSPDTVVTNGTVKLAAQVPSELRGLCDTRMISLYNSHTHNHNDPAGTTTTPNQQASTGSHATTNTTAS